MEEVDSNFFRKRLVPELGSPPPQNQQNQQNPISFSSNFFYKAAFFVICICLLPFFPSKAPDFLSQTILTRSWELLHLLLVGIAVSYGLFSHRNVDSGAEKEVPYKSDSPKSYVSRILHIPSVFDEDEADILSGSDENKVQTWNSQYFRGEPTVGFAHESSNNNSSISKPLLLPVRSLKSRVSEHKLIDADEEIDGNYVSGIRSHSALNDRTANRNSIRDITDLESLDLKDESEVSVVLPSSIPWRSRSGRMEVKDESGILLPPSCDLPVMESNLGNFKSTSFRSPSTRSTSSTSSPKKYNPSPSLSPELRAKTGEDLRRKKNYHKASPPPPPPPPPPPSGYKSSYISENNGGKRSFKDELKDFRRSGEDSLGSNHLGTDTSRLEMKFRNNSEGSSIGRSARTVRFKEAEQGMAADDTTVWPDQSVEKLNHVKTKRPPAPNVKYHSEKKNEFMRKFIIDSDDSDSDDDSESSDIEDAQNFAVEAETGENEVDKKADEFIAKFREQIRLQRIESIKRSNGKLSIRNPSSS